MVKNILNKKAIFVLVFMTFAMVSMVTFTNATTQTTTSSTSQQTTSSLPTLVKIGFLYPATGELGPIGQGVLDGAMAAAYRLNQTFGKQATNAFNVSIVPEDTATDPTTTAAAATTLLSDGVQVIVGAAGSSNTLAAAGVTVPASVPLISYASTSPALSVYNDSDYLMRTVASDLYQGVALANLTYNSGNHSVYVLNLNNAYGNGVYQQFKTQFEKLGGTVVGEIAYTQTATDFSSEISTIKASAASAIVMVSYPTDGNLIFTEAQTQSLNSMFFFGTDGIASTGVTNNTATRDFVNGKLFGTTPSSGINSSATLSQQFRNDLTATGGSYGIYSDYAYDAVLLAGTAVNASGVYNGPNIRDALYKVANGFKGATSSDKAFNCDGDPISQTYDYWNASNYKVTTMQYAAVSFTGLGNATSVACGLHPYVAPTTTSAGSTSSSGVVSSSTAPSSTPPSSGSSAPSPGFEYFIAISILGAISVIYLQKRKRS